MIKFEAGKTYRKVTKCGNYESVHELKVETINKNTIYGVITYYGILNGQKLDSFTYDICSKVRKEKGEDYQVTCSLAEVYKAINEVKENN